MNWHEQETARLEEQACPETVAAFDRRSYASTFDPLEDLGAWTLEDEVRLNEHLAVYGKDEQKPPDEFHAATTGGGVSRR